MEFEIQNLDKFEQKLLKSAARDFPDLLKDILETLGEIMSSEAKDVLRNDRRPHAKYSMMTHIITRGKNAGKKKNYLRYVGSRSTNTIDTGGLWNSLSRGNPGNIWVYRGGSGTFVLNFGTSLDYAKYINDGYVATPHWVPGTVGGNGKFRYQPGAKTGIYVTAHAYKGVKFFELGFEELERLAPEVIKSEFTRFASEFNA